MTRIQAEDIEYLIETNVELALSEIISESELAIIVHNLRWVSEQSMAEGS